MVVRSILVALGALTVFSSSVYSNNLYRIHVVKEEDAQTLRNAHVDAVLRLTNGYLVLATAEQIRPLTRAGLMVDLVATHIDRTCLYVDLRQDSLNDRRFSILYEEGNLRLLDISSGSFAKISGHSDVAPISSRSLPIVYSAPKRIDMTKARDLDDLDSLVNLISVDSCQSYVARLQAFNGRMSGTDSNSTSRDWLVSKFQEFGYDSVVLDTFIGVDNWGTGDTVVCHNVIACKPGTVFPNHSVVIGAHRDSWPLESPGADDDGTGTAAVLEIARVLAAIDTRTTIIFIAFDAEEFGLYGSTHYADAAAQRGDSIALMVNMDMIAYYEVTDSVHLYYTPSGSYGLLWRELADSLSQVGITTDLHVPANWDAQAFEQNGYEAFTLHEYVTLPYVHTAHDSAVYLDFDYMTRIVKATLATVYVVDNIHEISPLWFNLTQAPPEMMFPGIETHVELEVQEYGPGILIPGSVQLHYRLSEEPLASLPMQAQGGNSYSATIPPLPSMGSFHYYFSAEEATSGTIFFPDSSAPLISAVATHSVTTFEDDFNTDRGWQVTGGLVHGEWERAIPLTSGLWGAPRADYDGSGYCYVTDNRQLVGVTGGTTRLISPPISVTGGEALVRYARWYANYYPIGEPHADTFKVFARPNGANWQLAEMVGPVEEAAGNWFEHEFWVHDLFSQPDSIYVRFDASDQGEPSFVEAAVDAVCVIIYSCPPLILTSTLPDWTLGVPYTGQLEGAMCGDSLIWTDKYNDLDGSGLFLSTSGQITGTPVLFGAVSFVAMAADDSGRVDERTLSFQINPELTITTDTLPPGQEGQNYSHLLSADGGTGPRSWFDRDNDLQGSGLSLDATGLLSGSPLDTGVYSFTAYVEDEVGAVDEKSLSVQVNVFYVCGDVDNSGAGPNVADLTHLVDYLFRSGSPPPVLEAANIDGQGGVNVADLTYLVDYLFRSGPDPVCGPVV